MRYLRAHASILWLLCAKTVEASEFNRVTFDIELYGEKLYGKSIPGRQT